MCDNIALAYPRAITTIVAADAPLVPGMHNAVLRACVFVASGALRQDGAFLAAMQRMDHDAASDDRGACAAWFAACRGQTPVVGDFAVHRARLFVARASFSASGAADTTAHHWRNNCAAAQACAPTASRIAVAP
jgi:hypothetical protein